MYVQIEWWGADVVICLEQGEDLHIAQLMPLPLTLASVKSRLVLPFWYWLTWVDPEKGPLNGCVCVCVCVQLVLPCVAMLARYSRHVSVCPPACQSVTSRYCIKTIERIELVFGTGASFNHCAIRKYGYLQK